jgi:hypothetical protein
MLVSKITGSPSSQGAAEAPGTAGRRPEDRVILASCRLALGTASPHSLREVVTAALEWEYLLATATRHGVIPLLYQGLKTVSFAGVPEEAQKQLQGQFLENAQWSLHLSSELLTILTLLESHGIRAVPLKGPALSELLYGSVARRQFVDLDLLVRREDFRRIKELLVSHGYRPDLLLTKDQENLLLRSYYHQGFFHEAKGVLVELHWEIIRFFLSLPSYSEALWGRLERRSLLGKEVLSFSPEDLLLILCLHAAPHCWSRLAWVCDVAALIGRPGGIDWERLMEVAEKSGAGRMLFLGLALAQDLLAASLPPMVCQRMEADETLKMLVKEVHERLFPPPGYEPGIIRDTLFHVKLRETPREKIRHCLHTLFSPAFDDFLLYSLPPCLSPLYYLLRPVRLLRTYFFKRSTPA